MNIYKKGIGFAFMTAGISGFAVFINKFGVGFWGNPFTYTTAKNIVAALFLTGLIVLAHKLPELCALTRKSWIKLITIAFVGGSVPFLLFFQALTMVSASEAAFIHKTLFLWVALFSYPFLKERLSMIQLGALGMLFVGVFLFLRPSSAFTLSTGSLLALAATVLWAVENIIAKIALKDISAGVVGWARMFLGSFVLLGYLTLTGNLGGVLPASLPQLGWTLLVGVTLFGFVISWYSALKYAPATVVSSVLVIAAPFTAILNGMFVTHTFPTHVVFPLLIMIAAVLLLSQQFENFYSKLVRPGADVRS